MSLAVNILWFSSIALMFASLLQCLALWAKNEFHHSRKFQFYFGTLLAFLTISNNVENNSSTQLPIMIFALIFFSMITMETIKLKSSIKKFSIITATFVSITGVAFLFANYKHAFFIISAVIYIIFIGAILRNSKKQRASSKPEAQ